MNNDEACLYMYQVHDLQVSRGLRARTVNFLMIGVKFPYELFYWEKPIAMLIFGDSPFDMCFLVGR